MQRKDEMMKKMKNGHQLKDLEDWQEKKINETLSHFLDRTSNIDMKMMTEDLSDEERKQLQIELAKYWRNFDDEVKNSILNEKQRRKLEGKTK